MKKILIILLLIGLVGIVIRFSTFTVPAGEAAIVTQFGKPVATITEPGLNFKLPSGIEKVTKVNVKKIRTEEFGFSSPQTGARSRFRRSRCDALRAASQPLFSSSWWFRTGSGIAGACRGGSASAP